MASFRIMRMAVDAARADVAPILRVFTDIAPLPEAFWSDPYVLGYLSSVGGMAAEDATDGRLGQRDLATAAFRALGALAAKPVAELRAAVEDGGPEAVQEFEEGFLAAYKVAAVGTGSDEFDQDEVVRQARAFAAENKEELDKNGAPPDGIARLTGLVEAALFYRYVADTYFPSLSEERDAPASPEAR